jgi:hypothetical protein
LTAVADGWGTVAERSLEVGLSTAVSDAVVTFMFSLTEASGDTMT